MAFFPRFTYNDQIVRNLLVIERAKAVIDVIPLPPAPALQLKQAARQSATMASTAIEGNTLHTRAVQQALSCGDRSPGEMEQEVRNYWRALEWIEEWADSKEAVSQDFIRKLHRIIDVRGRGRRGTKSDYRRCAVPVTDTVTGLIEYAPPRWEDVVELMNELEAWLGSKGAQSLPAPIRAAILAHRFVSIHPFADGNGRTARALATAELWRSGYDLRGFLSIEEHFSADRDAYYANIQMGLPANFYEGRNDPDHTQWLIYFSGVMANAADAVRMRAEGFNDVSHKRDAPWESLSRRQQQMLTRMLTLGIERKTSAPQPFVPQDIVDWFGVARNTARDWLEEWRESGFIQAEHEDAQRIRKWTLSGEWGDLVHSAVDAFISKNP